MNKHKTGAIKDKKDDRDYLIKDYIKPTSIPTSLDLSNTMQPVRNQGDEGSCVAFAACAMKESQEDNEGHLSTRFLYERIKQPGGGAYPRDAMDILLNIGVCPEECQTYIPNTITTPCSNSLELSKQNKIKIYARLLTIDDMKQCLNQFGCFSITFMIYDGWIEPDSNHVVHTTGNALGGHNVTCCGYNNNTKLLKFKNSWGTSWGKEGYGYISYSDAITTLYDAWKSIDIPESDEEKLTPPEPEPKPEPWYILLWKWLMSLSNRIK